MRLFGGLIRIFVRLLFLPVRIAFAALGFGTRTGWKVGTAPVRIAVGTTRRAGVRGLACFGLGVGAGLLLAPSSGAELRAKLMGLVGGESSPPDPELHDRVAFELAHAPQTWHLPQPELAVVAGEVTLRGRVPHVEGRAALEQAAAAVPGVRSVRNDITVEPGEGVVTGEGTSADEGAPGADAASDAT